MKLIKHTNLLIVLFISAVLHAAPVFEQGVLDLRGVPQSEWNPSSMEGEWEFYWMQLLEPSDFIDALPGKPHYISAPATWNGLIVGQDTLIGQGFATYRLQVLYDSLYPRMAIYIASLGTASRIYVDGVLLNEAGQIGTSKENSQPGYKPGVFTFTPRNTYFDIIIQISNFDYARGGFWYNHTLVGTEQMVREHHRKRSHFAFLLVGAMFFFATYMFMLYFHNRNFVYSLYIGIACLFIALRTMVLNETLILEYFPNIPWELLIKLEYLPIPGGTLAFLFFQRYFFKHEVQLTIFRVYILLGVMLLILLLLPASIFTHLLVAYQLHMYTAIFYILYIAVQAHRKRREGARVFLGAFVVLAFTISLDLLFDQEYLYSGYPTANGFVVFIIALAYMLSVRYSRVSRKSKELAWHLEELNRDLEQRVENRTRKIVEQNKELHDKNIEIEQINKTKDMFFAILAHDLRNPIGAIHQLSDMMEDQFEHFTKDDILTNVRQIRRSSGETYAMLENLLQWALLQKGGLKSKPERVELLPLVQKNIALFQAAALQKGIVMELPEYEGRAVWADGEMINVVVRNLMHNAIKFSKENSRIRVEIVLEHSNWKVSICDQGDGIRIADQKLLFELKESKHSIKGKGQKGTGLGLVLCKDFVKRNGGSIGVESVEGDGATFFFTLPQYQENLGKA